MEPDREEPTPHPHDGKTHFHRYSGGIRLVGQCAFVGQTHYWKLRPEPFRICDVHTLFWVWFSWHVFVVSFTTSLLTLFLRLSPACGKSATGYTAAINQLSFGSSPGLGAGDACGRCFALTGTKDPYSPGYTGPFGQTIVVKVTDMCPVQGNQQFCGQTLSTPTNSFGAPFQ